MPRPTPTAPAALPNRFRAYKITTGPPSAPGHSLTVTEVDGYGAVCLSIDTDRPPSCHLSAVQVDALRAALDELRLVTPGEGDNT